MPKHVFGPFPLAAKSAADHGEEHGIAMAAELDGALS
jgi:hypothetical protein